MSFKLNENSILKKYKISDLKVGKKISITRVLNDQFLKESVVFLKDNHPVHVNTNWAKKLGYKKKIIPGLAITSFFSNLLGTKLPGIYCVIMDFNFTFKNPAYVNDKLKFSCKIIKIYNALKVVKVELLVKKEKTKIVIGIAKCKILK